MEQHQSKCYMARSVSMPQSDVRTFWEIKEDAHANQQISDQQMQWCADKIKQSLQTRGENGVDERAYISITIRDLKKITKAQAKMLESTVVPLLSLPQGGTAMDKIGALDYLWMTNSPIGEPYLSALLADPDKDVRKRAERYQKRRAAVR